MSIKIALAGNPNCGKTTLFNALTGSNQFVGNWPGVTVEKKEGKLKSDKEVIITDLPGIYSLSPYTLEEVVARNYLISEHPDAILNIVDGTNLERNLYLTTQLIEIGIPVVVAVNMMDVVRKNGDKINFTELSKACGCQVCEISALKGDGIEKAAQMALEAAKKKEPVVLPHSFSGPVEHAIAHIEENCLREIPEAEKRWYAIKVFERDENIMEKLGVSGDALKEVEANIAAAEQELDDDSESIITNERYVYIASVIKLCIKKKNAGKMTKSDKIDRIVTSRILALPIFAAIMFIVYYVSMVTVGSAATDWANDGLFGDGWHLFGTDVWVPGVPAVIGSGLDAVKCADWLKSLILDGIVAGVGAVLGFVPQILVLFIFLAFLEACGYMARIAFVMDRIFRRFGLSGKSFIPMLVGTGCGIPGIMASRTIENERDRRMTVMTTTFIPCGAKQPFIAMMAGAVLGGSPYIATSAYFIGVASVILSGIMLKKTRMFSGDPAPFVMELPAYHMPTVSNVLRSMWERGWSFIKKAGTVILLSTIFVWFASSFGSADGSFGMLDEEQMEYSILANIGKGICWLFIPLGWGNWQAAVAAVTGLVAKENIVGTMGVLYGGADTYANLGAAFTAVSGMSFLLFNLLCAPCFAAMGAIRREMNSRKWFWFAIGYECGFAYAVSLVVNQFGLLFSGNVNVPGLIAAIGVLGFMIYMLVRPYRESDRLTQKVRV